MKNYILLVGLICANSNCFSQNIIDTTKKVNVVHMPEYYKEKGVIFSEDYFVGIDMKGIKSRYTPTIDDLVKSEDIFSRKYNDIEKRNVVTRDFFCHWVRQYVGLIDSTGNKNIIVQLIDNRKPRKINKLLGKNWEDVFTIMLADSFYKVSKIFRININTGEMSTDL